MEHPISEKKWFFRCEHCKAVKSSNEKMSTICEKCNNKDDNSIFQYIIPKAFRTDFSLGKEAEEVDNYEFRGTGSFIEADLDHERFGIKSLIVKFLSRKMEMFFV